MSTTLLINQAVAEQRHASEQQKSRENPQRSGARFGLAECAHPNVGQGERTISLTAGAILAGLGLSRGGLSGLAMLGVGGALAFRGATGYCSVYKALGVDTAEA